MLNYDVEYCAEGTPVLGLPINEKHMAKKFRIYYSRTFLME